MIHRVLHDFWPVDASTIGPNLVASVIAFTAGYLAKGRSIVRGLHTKLDAHHDEQMAAHRQTHRAVGE